MRHYDTVTGLVFGEDEDEDKSKDDAKDIGGRVLEPEVDPNDEPGPRLDYLVPDWLREDLDGFHVDKRTTDPALVEVCRCGAPLPLPRNEDGQVVRTTGGQPRYCSERCRKDASNYRARIQRDRQKGGQPAPGRRRRC